MMRFALLILLLLPAPAFAQASNDLVMHDSVYYTMDDGIMSPQEMEMEATDVYRLCRSDPYQSSYIDCECLGGAFLVQREKDGPMTPQSDILSNILKKNTANCADTVNIAGNAYQNCMSHTASYREMARDNPEYCSCVGNKIARDFTRRPVLSQGYISEINYDAMIYCNDPANRPKKTAQTNQ